MPTTMIELTDSQITALDAVARRTGKTQHELMREAVDRLLEESSETAAKLFPVEDTEDTEEAEKFRLWREAAERLAGIWRDRDDLPDFAELRKSWDRGYGPKE